MKREDVINDLICYAANMKMENSYNDEQKFLIGEFGREWGELPCDPEGPTPAQDKEMDKLLDKYADKIISLI